MRLYRSASIGLNWSCLMLCCWALQSPATAWGSPPEADPEEIVLGRLEVPSEPGSLAPALLRLPEGRVILAWLQKSGEGHELRYGEIGARGVTAAKLAGRSEELFANWADRPGLHSLPDGTLAAHWLRRLGDETYAYGVEVLPLDQAEASPGFWLHDDTSPTEHGFVTSLRGEESSRFFWLDGRAMLEDGPMALRSATVTARGASASEVLDARVCECCPTDSAMTSQGPVVVYRDRSETEIRDIFIVRQTDDGWSAPRAVASDGWHIEGCPVNGPAVDAAGESVAVVWFTGAGKRPRVQIALSADSGASFAEPIVLDEARPVGRVDLQIADGLVHASWLARRESGGAIVLATLPLDGSRPPSQQILVDSGLGRSAGYPRIAVSNGQVLLAWVEQAESAEGGTQPLVRLHRLLLR